MRINVVNKYKHKKTENDFPCHRPYILGNPYTHIKDKKTKAQYIVGTREEAIEKHKKDFLIAVGFDKEVQKEIDKMLHRLKKSEEINLVCYCAPKSCHCDTIKKYLLFKIDNSECEHCYDTGWASDGDRCVCVRKWDTGS